MKKSQLKFKAVATLLCSSLIAATVYGEKSAQVVIKNSQLKNYQTASQQLIKQIEQPSSSNKQVAAAAEKLMEIAKPILKQFATKHSECTQYLNIVLDKAAEMTRMSEEQLEKDYHDDGALPKAAGTCYNAKDLVVHPATVVVLARQKPSKDAAKKQKLKTKMVHEIEETLAHLSVVDKLL